MKAEKRYYDLVDYTKFIMAFFVICIHVRPLYSRFPSVDDCIKDNVLCYAVLFFLVSTGFLIYRASEDGLLKTVNKQIPKYLNLYIKWTVIFLPLTIWGWYLSDDSLAFDIIYFIRNFFFVGENYYSWALWYLLGVAVAFLILRFLLKKGVSVQRITFFALTLYAVGYLIKGILEYQSCFPQWILVPVKVYNKVFVTTRNGIFECFPYITLGMLMARKQERHVFSCVVGAAALVTAKSIVYEIGGGVPSRNAESSNMLVPFSTCF